MEIQKPKLVGPVSFPWLTAVLTVVAIGEKFTPIALNLFVYDRTLILQGQWWRLWSAHLAHYSFAHLFWNLLVFVPVGVWLERVYPHYTRLFLIIAPAFISALLWHFNPELQRYAGMSGVAFGALAMLAFFELRREPTQGKRFWGLVLLLMAIKLTVEFGRDGRALFVSFPSDFRNVPLSHLAGALCAALVFALAMIGQTTGRGKAISKTTP